MFFQNKTLLITLFAVIAMGTVTGKRDCSKECSILFKCDPFFDDPVWTMINGVCIVFKNPCIFASENCSRQNQCLKPLEEVSKEKCQENCAICKEKSESNYCVVFPDINDLGDRVQEPVTFASKCLADQYACANAEAFISGQDCE